MSSTVGHVQSRSAVSSVALAIWATVQLAALLLSAARIPLSDEFVRPAERAAVEVMLFTQFCAVAALFPLLMPNAYTVAAVAATSWPFVHLAALLASRPIVNVVSAWVYLVLWIIFLSIWRHFLRNSPRWLLIAATLALCAAVGGAILCYLRAEFAGADEASGISALCGPAVAAMALARASDSSAGPWLWMGGALSATLAIWLVLARMSSRTDARSADR